MSPSTREGPHRSSPRIHTSRNGYRVVEIPAGPARPIRADDFLPYIGDFGSFLRGRGKHDRPDVVHAQFWTSGLAAALATRASRVSVVQTFHTLTEDAIHPNMPALSGSSAETPSGSSRRARRSLVRRGIPRKRISVIPSGVDVSWFSPDGCCLQRTGLHRMVCAGQLVRSKGFDVAIAALARLPDTELLVAGEQIPKDPEAARL